MRKFLPYFLIDGYHFFLALLGAFLYRFPSKKLKVVGVTGTNGKSTTIDLIARIFEEAGYKVASFSSIKFKIGKEEEQNELRMTMPGRMILQKFLRQAVNADCQYAILEVTSEGIKQHRHRFIDFDCAVFTNLSPEHIEAHGSFEKYREAKGRFFRGVKGTHIVNLDDENAEYFLKFPARTKYGYTMNNKQKTMDNNKERLFTVHCSLFISKSSGISFEVEGVNFNLNLLGRFNAYNALAAICVALSQGIDLETCKNGLEKVKGIPGRMEIVISKPFTVFVDYAFTPNALEQVYSTLTNLYKSTPNIREYSRSRQIGDQDSRKFVRRKLICVLGACGGGRDKWKRPVLGELAGKYCDEIIITNEDPYDENPNQILLDIKSGISNDKIQMTNLILDRKEAIRKSLELARPGDVVVITGKGCEPSICVAGGKRISWDDRRVVREEFQKLKSNI